MLPSQLQPPPRAPQPPPEKVVIPSTVKLAREAEKRQEVGVQEACHVYVRVGAVTGPLDATYRGPYCVLIKERKKLLLEVGAVGLCRPPEAAHSGPSCGAAASMWQAQQVLV